MKKKRILPIIMLMCSVLLCACNHNRKSMKNEYAEKDGEKEYAESTYREADTDRQIEKGYNLPIDARQRAEAEEDCKEMMGLILVLYKFGSKLPNSLLVAVPQAQLAVCGGIKMQIKAVRPMLSLQMKS